MARVRARVGEFFAAIDTFKRFLAAVYPQVLLEVVFEFERLVAVVTLVLA